MAGSPSNREDFVEFRRVRRETKTNTNHPILDLFKVCHIQKSQTTIAHPGNCVHRETCGSLPCNFHRLRSESIATAAVDIFYRFGVNTLYDGTWTMLSMLNDRCVRSQLKLNRGWSVGRESTLGITITAANNISNEWAPLFILGVPKRNSTTSSLPSPITFSPKCKVITTSAGGWETREIEENLIEFVTRNWYIKYSFRENGVKTQRN